MALKKWPLMIGGLVAAGVAVGMAGALVSRRRQRKWNEFAANQHTGRIGESGRAGGPARSTMDTGASRTSSLGAMGKDNDVLSGVRGASNTEQRNSGLDIGASVAPASGQQSETYPKAGSSRNSRSS